MYNWRKMTPEERQKALSERKVQRRAWHQPPKFEYVGSNRFLVTAACYEHKKIIGKNSSRMSSFESDLLALCDEIGSHVYAWCVLPNHYHVLIRTDDIEWFKKELGLLHGRTSFEWNGEDQRRGRKVWFRSVERRIKSVGHFWAAMNYVHNNPVKHGYVENWLDWPYSSAREYLETVGRDVAIEIWREYPVDELGQTWDLD